VVTLKIFAFWLYTCSALSAMPYKMLLEIIILWKSLQYCYNALNFKWFKTRTFQRNFKFQEHETS